MAGRERRELFRPSTVEVTKADQDRTNLLLRKSCEGRFEITIGSGIHNNELQAQAFVRIEHQELRRAIVRLVQALAMESA